MTQQYTIIEERLDRVTRLEHGAHNEPNGDFAACAMEAVSYVAGEDWTDHPKCACPVISAFMRAWNDGLPDDERTELLLPLVPRLVGTKGDAKLEERRTLMAADWLVRTHTPAWLRLAGLVDGVQVSHAERAARGFSRRGREMKGQFGEPWMLGAGNYFSHQIHNGSTVIGEVGGQPNAERIIACVNALASIPDPVDAVERAKGALKEAVTWFEAYAEHAEHGRVFDLTRARAALAALGER